MLSELICLYCRAIPTYEVVSVSATGADAVVAIRRLRPDVVLLDLGLPDMPPRKVIEAVMAVAGPAKVIACTSLLSPLTLRLVEQCKLPGYLDKLSGHMLGLKEAITTVLAGRIYRPVWFRAKLEEVRAMPDSFVRILTDQEEEVLVLIGASLTNGQIALQLGMSERTARAWRTRIMGKVNCHSTPELIRYAIDKGFTVPDNVRFRQPPPDRTAAQEQRRKQA